MPITAKISGLSRGLHRGSAPELREVPWAAIIDLVTARYQVLPLPISAPRVPAGVALVNHWLTGYIPS